MASRTLSIGLLLVYCGVLLAPFAITLDFLVNRDRIARGLCVQRAVPEGMRTCHGQCHLMKQLLAEKEGSRSPATPPTLPEKIHPELMEAAPPLMTDERSIALNWNSLIVQLPVGCSDPADPVPWS